MCCARGMRVSCTRFCSLCYSDPELNGCSLGRVRCDLCACEQARYMEGLDEVMGDFFKEFPQFRPQPVQVPLDSCF